MKVGTHIIYRYVIKIWLLKHICSCHRNNWMKLSFLYEEKVWFKKLINLLLPIKVRRYWICTILFNFTRLYITSIGLIRGDRILQGYRAFLSHVCSYKNNDCSHCSSSSIIRTVPNMFLDFDEFIKYYWLLSTQTHTEKNTIRKLLINTEELKRIPCPAVNTALQNKP